MNLASSLHRIMQVLARCGRRERKQVVFTRTATRKARSRFHSAREHMVRYHWSPERQYRAIVCGTRPPYLVLVLDNGAS